MSFLSRLFKRSSPENPQTSLANPDQWLLDLMGARGDAGVNVTPSTALTLSAVWQAVSLLSGDFAKLPLCVYERTESGGRKKAIEHPAYYPLRRKPNGEMTAGVFKRTLMLHALLWGNAYAYIFRDNAARPIELVLLLPDRTEPARDNGQLYYKTTVNGQPRKLAAANVLHFRGLGFDGLKGYSVVSMARQSFGLALAAEKFGNKFFANGSRASGILTYPGKLKQAAAENLKTEFEEKHQGLDNAHRTVLLQEGAKFTPLTINPDDAQFLQTRQFQKEEIASWFNCPRHKLGAGSATTSYASLEQENQSYLDSCLDPWLSTFEEEVADKLLTEAEKRGDTHFVEFNRSALLRTDFKTRYEAYATGRQWGWLSVNKVLQLENLESIGPEGDMHLVPMNMTPADQIGKASEGERIAALKAAHRTILVDVFGRMIRRAAQSVRGAVKHADFSERLDDTLAGYETAFREATAPALAALRAVCRDDTLRENAIARRHVAMLRSDIDGAVEKATPETLAADVESRVAAWEKSGAEALADELLGAT